ncbi:MAG: hypothetical protein ACT4PT_04410 [Methanobacteriota archaeon]
MMDHLGSAGVRGAAIIGALILLATPSMAPCNKDGDPSDCPAILPLPEFGSSASASAGGVAAVAEGTASSNHNAAAAQTTSSGAGAFSFETSDGPNTLLVMRPGQEGQMNVGVFTDPDFDGENATVDVAVTFGEIDGVVWEDEPEWEFGFTLGGAPESRTFEFAIADDASPGVLLVPFSLAADAQEDETEIEIVIAEPVSTSSPELRVALGSFLGGIAVTLGVIYGGIRRIFR